MSKTDETINARLEVYRAECEKAGVTRNMDVEGRIFSDAIAEADPMDVLRSVAFGALKDATAFDVVRRAILGLAPAPVEHAPEAAPAEAETPKKRRKQKETE